MRVEAEPVRSILFVCTGNICRSPTAEGVFRALAAEAGLLDGLRVDSCGLTSFHVGEPPSRPAIEHAAKRGYDLAALRARAFAPADFERFDLLLAMDDGHYAQLARRASAEARRKVAFFLDAAPDAPRRDVPDPYYGGAAEYELALDLIEAGCRGWIERLRAA
ncbi:MAG: low molecular weight protein-tyrosine-phosphatase [Marivibrio sp.]|uniref:low molecular weight protein-tyrosine-phosphatase n=1 Tax=Marivibrio sp. TaxID=2039719 RepID=UPI0032F00A35